MKPINNTFTMQDVTETLKSTFTIIITIRYYVYKQMEISTSIFGQILECQKCNILVVTWALVLCLIRILSIFRHTYQANHLCPSYNYYRLIIQVHKFILISAFDIDNKYKQFQTSDKIYALSKIINIIFVPLYKQK